VFTILNPRSQDTDFGTNPILYKATINGARRSLVAAGQKSGVFWALDRETGEVVWSTAVSPGSALIGGFLNNGAYDGERIIAAGSNGSSTAPGSEEPVVGNRRARLVALDPATGDIIWERQVGNWVWAPITVANGVGYVAVDTTLQAFDAGTGQKLFTFPTNGTITSAPVVAEGRVHFGSGTSYFATTPARDFFVLSLDGRAVGPTPTPGVYGGTTFTAIYADIIVGQGCTTSACHGSSQGNLLMSTRDEDYENLIDVPAAGPLCTGVDIDRVEPGDPENSLLYDKIAAETPVCGDPMPPAAPLPEESIARIRAWIEGGAPDD
jgi:outer membrane protein assembly factor BamB